MARSCRRAVMGLSVVFAILAGMGASPSRAGYVSGVVLLGYCQDPASSFCAGYLASLVDYQDALQHSDQPALRFCLPDNIKLSDLRDLTVDQLQINPPSELRKLAASLVIPALVRKFPCR